jgi:ATP-dependent Lhr-like helicase
MFALDNPGNDIVWLSAMDLYQPYGRFLPHSEEQSFQKVAGSFVALHRGLPIAVWERQAKTLRIFAEEQPVEALRLFVQGFEQKSLYPTLARIIVKQYPKEAEQALIEAGFRKEITDYVLYRR